MKALTAKIRQLVSEHEECGARMAPMEAKLAEKERAIEQLQSLMSNMDETRGQVANTCDMLPFATLNHLSESISRCMLADTLHENRCICAQS